MKVHSAVTDSYDSIYTLIESLTMMRYQYVLFCMSMCQLTAISIAQQYVPPGVNPHQYVCICGLFIYACN